MLRLLRNISVSIAVTLCSCVIGVISIKLLFALKTYTPLGWFLEQLSVGLIVGFLSVAGSLMLWKEEKAWKKERGTKRNC